MLNDDLAELEVLWCFRDTDSAVIHGQNKRLFESMAPAITRGRFRCYGGIDCHSVFSEFGTELTATSASLHPVTTHLPTETNFAHAVKNNTPRNQNIENDFIDRYFSNRLEEALESFSHQPKFWIDPIIADCAEVERDAEHSHEVLIAAAGITTLFACTT